MATWYTEAQVSRTLETGAKVYAERPGFANGADTDIKHICFRCSHKIGYGRAETVIESLKGGAGWVLQHEDKRCTTWW
jgi:hypothetical protein